MALKISYGNGALGDVAREICFESIGRKTNGFVSIHFDAATGSVKKSRRPTHKVGSVPNSQ